MCVVGSNSLNPDTETTVMTRCLDCNTACSCLHLKCNDFYFYPSSLTTFLTSFGGRCLFT